MESEPRCRGSGDFLVSGVGVKKSGGTGGFLVSGVRVDCLLPDSGTIVSPSSALMREHHNCLTVDTMC